MTALSLLGRRTPLEEVARQAEAQTLAGDRRPRGARRTGWEGAFSPLSEVQWLETRLRVVGHRARVA